MDLKQEQVEQLAQRLESRRKELLGSLRQHLARSRQDNPAALGETVGDEADLAFAEILHDTDSAALRRDVRELRDIEAACTRMAAGQYGSCIDCGREIAHARLVAYPAAVRCVDCESLYERTHASPDERPS